MSRSSDPLDSNRYRTLISDLDYLDSNLNSPLDNGQSLNNLNCKYYNCQEFNTLTSSFKSGFSLLHLNISSLGRHFDEFNTLLSLLDFNFCLIGISETRFLKCNPPSFDFSIEGYSTEHTPTESSAGGTLLYISNRYVYSLRSDLANLMYRPRELESVFVEISLNRKSNILIGCVYRHPGMCINTFNMEHLTPLLQRLSKENKSVFFSR